MPQDFAKRRVTTNKNAKSASQFSVFISGFIAGVFSSFLIYLWQSNLETEITMDIPKQTISNKVEEMQWDFYEIFPKSEVQIIDEYSEQQEPNIDDMFFFILQTGSFQVEVDADARRAELLLLGLDVFIQEVEIEGETWYRVMVGPLENELARNRAQDKLAQAEIASLPLRVRN